MRPGASPETASTTNIEPRRFAASDATRSDGLYRIPYIDGTSVRVTNDHTSHDPPNRIDMHGTGGGPYRIVAAADGVVRHIVDRFSANRPGKRPCNNNYVWIEHDNGEWTKYSHMSRRSVSRDAGLSVDDRVRAGTFLGFESDVGCAHGKHLHFEVAVPIDPGDPIDSQGFIIGDWPRNRVPRMCGIEGELLVADSTYIAAACAAVVVSPTTLSFSSVRPGATVHRGVTVTNLSGRSLTVSLPRPPAGGAFTWVPLARSIDNGARLRFDVAFRPRSSAIERSNLRIATNGPGSPHNVGLVGKGVGGLPTPDPDRPPIHEP